LLLWRINPSLIGNGFCGGAAVNLGLPEKTAVNFEVQAWNPAQVTWQEYEKYLDNKFKNLKAEYRKKMEVSARERGLKKVPFLRADKKFEWLVRHLVRGENYEKIADGAGCDPDNVKIRIREAARACGLQRLPPGRPRRET
jgi:DNA-directed RNA polymerase specialized sigma24 family protein